MPMGCRVFTDGSLQDALLGRHFAALGWAFVVIDQGGNVMAAAHGVPPPWVNTIQGAELWAVKMVWSNVVFPSHVFTDCKPCKWECGKNHNGSGPPSSATPGSGRSSIRRWMMEPWPTLWCGCLHTPVKIGLARPFAVMGGSCRNTCGARARWWT